MGLPRCGMDDCHQGHRARRLAIAVIYTGGLTASPSGIVLLGACTRPFRCLALVLHLYAYNRLECLRIPGRGDSQPQRNMPRAIIIGTGHRCPALPRLERVGYALAFTAPQIKAMLRSSSVRGRVKAIARRPPNASGAGKSPTPFGWRWLHPDLVRSVLTF